MPVIFNETNFDKYRILLLESGLELAKQGGLKKITVESVTKRAGIAKGTFYTFFPSKEEFIYQIAVYNRNKAKDYYRDLVEKNGKFNKKQLKEFLTFLFLSQNNIYTYLTQEDYAYLRSRWPFEYSLDAKADEQTTTWMLDSMNTRSGCDWKVVANLMKAVALVGMEKEMLHQEVYQQTMELLLDSIVDYIFGKED